MERGKQARRPLPPRGQMVVAWTRMGRRRVGKSGAVQDAKLVGRAPRSRGGPLSGEDGGEGTTRGLLQPPPGATLRPPTPALNLEHLASSVGESKGLLLPKKALWVPPPLIPPPTPATSKLQKAASSGGSRGQRGEPPASLAEQMQLQDCALSTEHPKAASVHVQFSLLTSQQFTPSIQYPPGGNFTFCLDCPKNGTGAGG